MKTLLLALALALTFSANAHADTQDRINDCERAGGGSCVFDLLRELANRHGEGGSSRSLDLGAFVMNGNGGTAQVLSSNENFLQIQFSGGTVIYKCDKGSCTANGGQFPNDPAVQINAQNSFTRDGAVWTKR